MTKQDFEILMNSLYSNNQLFIPQGQNIKEWVDNAFVEKQEEAINYSRCCKSDSELLSCNHCKGTGKVHYDNGTWQICYTCGGSGTR